MDAHASDTVLRLVAGYHANLLARSVPRHRPMRSDSAAI